MKLHTTNYYNTFIEIADDCPVKAGQTPPMKEDKKSVANYQFDILRDQPYQFTSDDILFEVFALRNDIDLKDRDKKQADFFSKGQACLRSSPLTKRYGWGVYSNGEGKVALYGAETEEYQKLVNDPSVKKVKAMRSKRK